MLETSLLWGVNEDCGTRNPYESGEREALRQGRNMITQDPVRNPSSIWPDSPGCSYKPWLMLLATNVCHVLASNFIPKMPWGLEVFCFLRSFHFIHLLLLLLLSLASTFLRFLYISSSFASLLLPLLPRQVAGEGSKLAAPEPSEEAAVAKDYSWMGDPQVPEGRRLPPTLSVSGPLNPESAHACVHVSYSYIRFTCWFYMV